MIAARTGSYEPFASRLDGKACRLLVSVVVGLGNMKRRRASQSCFQGLGLASCGPLTPGHMPDCVF